MKHQRTFSSFSVDNLDRAEAFYRDVLGLRVSRNRFGLTLHTSGRDGIFVYPKADHTPATFTVLNFVVDDVERAADVLEQRGVRFERYDDQLMRGDDRGIYRNEGMTIAWFKDPAGNVLSILEDEVESE